MMLSDPASNRQQPSLASPQSAQRRFDAISLLSSADGRCQVGTRCGVSGWLVNGMQGVRGSNPLSSTPGQRPSPPSTTRASRPSRSRYAATTCARLCDRRGRRSRGPASPGSSPGRRGPLGCRRRRGRGGCSVQESRTDSGRAACRAIWRQSWPSSLVRPCSSGTPRKAMTTSRAGETYSP
jgi:hypothetical protein